MAGTDFAEVYDNLMQIVDDYKLVNLYNQSVSDFQTYLSSWLLNAISDFKNCDQSLAYTSSTFSETLSQKNILMLAYLMKKYWLEKQIDDLKQMSLKITDHDFKTYAEANNMAAKLKRYQEMKEELSQKLADYTMNYSIDWASWLNGQYYVP